MKKFSLQWTPRDLTEFQEAQRVKDSQMLLKALKALKVDARNDVVNIITGDEGWCH
jgi:hypothetical protein